MCAINMCLSVDRSGSRIFISRGLVCVVWRGLAWFGLAWLLVWVAGLGLVGRVGLDRVVNDKDRQKSQKKKTKKTSAIQQAKGRPVQLG